MSDFWNASITDWIGALAGFASLLAAAAAIYLADQTSKNQERLQKRITREQTALQERQLKQDLFEKRYTVYAAIQKWLSEAVRVDGSIGYGSIIEFHYVTDQANFLFGGEIISFIEEVGTILVAVQIAAQKRDRLIERREEYRDAEKEVNRLLDIVTKELSYRRDDIFRSYLQLHR